MASCSKGIKNIQRRLTPSWWWKTDRAITGFSRQILSHASVNTSLPQFWVTIKYCYSREPQQLVATDIQINTKTSTGTRLTATPLSKRRRVDGQTCRFLTADTSHLSLTRIGAFWQVALWESSLCQLIVMTLIHLSTLGNAIHIFYLEDSTPVVALFCFWKQHFFDAMGRSFTTIHHNETKKNPSWENFRQESSQKLFFVSK